MRIMFFGNGERGLRCLWSLVAGRYEIQAVIIHHTTQSARNSNPITDFANRHSIPVLMPENINSPESLDALSAFNPDLIVMSGYTQILKKPVLERPTIGVINLHGGRLPEYRGGSPINWQIINGESEGGVAVHFVDEGIDTGAILASETFPIGENETAGDIYDKTITIFPDLMIRVIRELEIGIHQVQKQKISDGTYYCKRLPRDGRIDWSSMSARQVHDLVRALNGPSYPGAFTYLNQKKIIVWRTEKLDDVIRGPVGRVALNRKGGVVVLCKDRGILLDRIKVKSDGRVIPSQEVLSIGQYLK